MLLWCADLHVPRQGPNSKRSATAANANTCQRRPKLFHVRPDDGFSYSKGTPKVFTRSDLENPVTREFCENCGTHILTRRPGLDQLILKVGTLDDATEYRPAVAIHTLDQQAFHEIAEGIPTFDRLPPRPSK